MRGTGSHTWVAGDVFVPEHRLISVNTLSEGWTTSDEPVHRLPFAPVATLALVGTLLGLGGAALALTIDKAPSKPMHHTFFARQSDSVGVQVQLAGAALKLETAQLHAYRVADDLDSASAKDATRTTGFEPGREPSSATRHAPAASAVTNVELRYPVAA
jgi:3-hydroxy-9,10-secoandrosta-1,3,5(10)-triene-9,17-dione monooxygenase